jgi:hypothetical protein
MEAAGSNGRVYKSPQLNPIMRQVNPVHTHTHYSFKIHHSFYA